MFVYCKIVINANINSPIIQSCDNTINKIITITAAAPAGMIVVLVLLSTAFTVQSGSELHSRSKAQNVIMKILLWIHYMIL